MKTNATVPHNNQDLTTCITEEFKGADYGSRRLSQRLVAIGQEIAQQPDQSYPSIFTKEKDLESYYRFLSNDVVSFEETLQPHYDATYRRAKAAKTALAIHDTTSFGFSGEKGRKDVGYITSKQQGFFAHITLLASADGSRNPLGIGSVTTWNRNKPEPVNRGQNGQKKKHKAKPWDERESRRWGKQVDAVEARLEEGTTLIHVMDREGDAYDILAGLIQKHRRFIIRLNHDRNSEATVDGKEVTRKLKALLRSAPQFEMEREVTISERPTAKRPHDRKTHPARKQRVARLQFGAHALRLKRPQGVPSSLPCSIEVNGVRVVEVDPPAGEEPIEWLILTKEEIQTAEDIAFVVDSYRDRWLIEDYNKAIKSGCAYETRQMESLKTLLMALAILIPIAWWLLKMRYVCRTTPNAPATVALSSDQIEVLRHISPSKLGPAPTLREAMMAIAKLGGHIIQNGEPGFLVILRGIKRLIFAEQIWKLAQSSERSLLSTA